MQRKMLSVWLILVLITLGSFLPCAAETQAGGILPTLPSQQNAGNQTQPPSAADAKNPAAGLFSLQDFQFGDHDIGTRTPKEQYVINPSDAPATLKIDILDDIKGDFSVRSDCLMNLPAKGKCLLIVEFAPTIIGTDTDNKDQERAAKLRVRADNSKDEQEVTLDGKAFRNLGVAPEVLEFEGRLGNTAGIVRNVLVTNYTNATVNSLTVTATGDFTENHSTCVTIVPGGSCTIAVTYSAKLTGETSGSLTITSNPSGIGKLPRVVALRGVGTARCSSPKTSWLQTPGLCLVMIVSGLYFLALVLVRWHMIAKPARAQVVAEVDAVRARVLAEKAALPNSPEVNERVAVIHDLLDRAVYAYRHKHFPFSWQHRENSPPPPPVQPAMPAFKFARGLLSTLAAIFFLAWLVGTFYHAEFGWAQYLLLALWAASLAGLIIVVISNWPKNPNFYPWFTRLFNAFFWTRGHELASWSLAHEAELQMVPLLPLERVRARLETAEQELRDIKSPVALALADRIHQSLATEAALIQDCTRELLKQLLSLLKPMSLPQAALSLWLQDFQQRALDCLKQVHEWFQKSSAPAPNPSECQSRLQQLSQIAQLCADLVQEIQSLLPRISTDLKPVLQRCTGLFNLVAGAPTQAPNPQISLDDCNKFLASLAAKDPDAAKLIEDWKTASWPKDQTVTALRDSYQLQASAVQSAARAVTPDPCVVLVQKILSVLQPQTEPMEKISSTPAQAGAGLGPLLPMVTQLATVPQPSQDLIDEINRTLCTEPPSILRRWQALLAEALSLIYDNTDSGFFQLATWHNQMIWLVGCALLLIFALSVTLQNALLLLVGAIGGLLSRLQRATVASNVANDYGATWGALFLSPLTGALSAWGGILLIILGGKFNIFGTALNVDWCNPFDPITLALALLFGFMERLFDGVAGQLQDKLAKASGSASPAPSPAAPAPKITSLSPTSAALGKEVPITVRGENFQSGASATVTDESGTPQQAKLEFKDPKTVVVTCTPKGAKPFTATMAITNPDKQTDTFKLSVTASS